MHNDFYNVLTYLHNFINVKDIFTVDFVDFSIDLYLSRIKKINFLTIYISGYTATLQLL